MKLVFKGNKEHAKQKKLQPEFSQTRKIDNLTSLQKKSFIRKRQNKNCFLWLQKNEKKNHSESIFLEKKKQT